MTQVNSDYQLYRTLLKLCLLVGIITSVGSLPVPLDHSHHYQHHLQQRKRIQSHDDEKILPSSVIKAYHGDAEDSTREKRAVYINGRWPNATIPFAFDRDSFTLSDRNRVLDAMKLWQKKTCIRFVDRTNEEFFVLIEHHASECSSQVGMKTTENYRGDGQPLKLSPYCLEPRNRGNIVHELGHALGFYHEHQRPDRDDFVEILFDNMIEDRSTRSQYDIISNVHNLGVPYDYNSIMHYGPYANTINGNATMRILDSRFTNVVGQRLTPSSKDYRQANLLYRCREALELEYEESDDYTLKERPDLLPSNSRDIRSGDPIALSPQVDSNDTWWLNCTDMCTISNSAGKKFKNNDALDYPELIFEMQKIAGIAGTEYIKVGDTVALKYRLPTGQVNIVSCSFPERVCANKSDCIIGTGDGGKFDESLGCTDDVYVVGAMGKSAGDQLSHRDGLILYTMTSLSNNNMERTMQSWMECEIDQSDTGGDCSEWMCSYNEFGEEETSSDLNECDEPFTFRLTKL